MIDLDAARRLTATWPNADSDLALLLASIDGEYNMDTVPVSTTSSMTLDDAIEHARIASVSDTKCGSEHAQLAEWLSELKARRNRSSEPA